MNTRPNILWICTDQQRYDTISALGNTHIRTPNMDRLVREGVSFNRAYCQNPICSPSRGSFMTGRYPRTTRSFINGNDTFSKDETLVTKLLADGGYNCGLVGKLHLTSHYRRMEERLDDGFRYFEWSPQPCDDWPVGINRYMEWLKDKGVDWHKEYVMPCEWPPRNGYMIPERIKGMDEEYHQTTWCMEKAMDFINGYNGDEPWCLCVNPFDPHPPFDPPDAYKERLRIEDMPLPAWKEGELDNKPFAHKDCYLHGSQKGMVRDTVNMTDLEKQEVTRDYYAEIELMDTQIGRVLDFLDEKDLRKDTLIVFMSDHGEMLGDHGIYWKGGYFYDSLIRVPLIISWPGHILQNVVSDALVELVDIAPTLLEAAGLPVPQYMQGKSLMSLLKGETDKDFHKERVYTEFYFSTMLMHHIYATMMFDGRYKIAVHHGEEVGELYDLQSDPNEFDNLWDDPNYEELKNRKIKECFDHTILCNIDRVLGRRFNY